jgi:hypothetical protein
VTPDDVAGVLREHGVPPDFEVLNLDLDSFDLPVARALLEGFRPVVVDLEVNEKVPPPVRFAVRYSPGLAWDESHCYGCSLSAAHDVLRRAGYRLEGLEYNNAFFVRGDEAEAVGIEDLEPADAYRRGYAERADRRALFPWNADVDDLHAAEPEEVVRELRRRFRRSRARFALQTEPLGRDWEREGGGCG